jgi:K+-sensing histidine kinase KdpD
VSLRTILSAATVALAALAASAAVALVALAAFFHHAAAGLAAAVESVRLAGNAIKYSPGGGRVPVGLTAADGRATLSVADQGLGIAPENRPHVFEPFRRGSRHDGIPGMGLGLSVARRIVEAHGGALELESEPGAGAVFRVRLPLTA